MIDVKNEMRYILVTRLLEQAAEAGLLSAEELWTAKRLALERYHPARVSPIPCVWRHTVGLARTLTSKRHPTLPRSAATPN